MRYHASRWASAATVALLSTRFLRIFVGMHHSVAKVLVEPRAQVFPLSAAESADLCEKRHRISFYMFLLGALHIYLLLE